MVSKPFDWVFKIKLPEDMTELEARQMFVYKRNRDAVNNIVMGAYKLVLEKIKMASISAANQFKSWNVKELYNKVITQVANNMESVPELTVNFAEGSIKITAVLFDFEKLRALDRQKKLSSQYERFAGIARGRQGEKSSAVTPIASLSNFRPVYANYSSSLFDILEAGSKGGAVINPQTSRLTFLGDKPNSKRSREKITGKKRTWLLQVLSGGQYGFNRQQIKKPTDQIKIAGVGDGAVLYGKNGIFKYAYRQTFTMKIETDINKWFASGEWRLNVGRKTR